MPFHGNQFRNSINMAWLSRNCHHWSVTQILHQTSPWCHTNLVSEWSWCGMGPRIDPNVISKYATVECCYNTVQYNMVLLSSLQEVRQNINQILHPQKTPHSSSVKHQSEAAPTKDTPYLTLMGELWGVFREYYGENWPRYNSTALYLANHFASEFQWFLVQYNLAVFSYWKFVNVMRLCLLHCCFLTFDECCLSASFVNKN